MNERITELALQAEDWADNQNFYESDYRDYFMEKFAQLIVRDCIAMADDFECDVNQRGLVDRMKQHFGVEE